jgi:hypothetical protein
VEQEAAHGRRLEPQHLLGQVVHHVPVAAGEARDERRRVAAAAQRERGELEAGGPALGALIKEDHVRGRQRGDAHAVA